MFDELGETGVKLASESSVRAVVLRGAGGNFCAGIDVSVFGSTDLAIDAAALAPLVGRIANRFQLAATVWRDLPVPVICAIDGVAYGAGLQIALGAAYGLLMWVVNFYIVVLWVQPQLVGEAYILQLMPAWVAIVTHLIYGLTLGILQPIGRFVPYRPATPRVDAE